MSLLKLPGMMQPVEMGEVLLISFVMRMKREKVGLREYAIQAKRNTGDPTCG